MFELITKYQPAGDQPQAIKTLLENIKNNVKHQVLLGATATGKTFTIANIIQKTNLPTLVLAHNKTLAAQLYGEFQALFPHNKVEYFISNFDYYQPEAYLPGKDLYIDKEAIINEDIDRMRLSALNALVHHRDVIVVASVAAIYAEFDPAKYKLFYIKLHVGQKLTPHDLALRAIGLGYTRDNFIKSKRFRIRGDVFEIMLGDNDEKLIRVEFDDEQIDQISVNDALSNVKIETCSEIIITPATDYLTDPDLIKEVMPKIKAELLQQKTHFEENGQLIEAQRLQQRTEKDLADMLAFGGCKGIENYSRYLENRLPGQPPFTLLDYFKDEWLLVVDESHMSLSQIQAMHHTDASRKKNLIEYGFRLPSAADNRPLNYDEFLSRTDYVIYTSATPSQTELNLAGQHVVQQIIRPTGLLDPIVEVKPTANQINHFMAHAREQIALGYRVLALTLTKKMAEALSTVLIENNFKATYLHSETDVLERNVILTKFRRGAFDVLVGINLLREGIDLPEVSFIAIFDAEQEGFLRNARSLIQIIGRAARNASGHVYLYADRTTMSMAMAMRETTRRRTLQTKYNQAHNIVPTTTTRAINDALANINLPTTPDGEIKTKLKRSEREKIIKQLQTKMRQAAKNLAFEEAAQLRDLILEEQTNLQKYPR